MTMSWQWDNSEVIMRLLSDDFINTVLLKIKCCSYDCEKAKSTKWVSQWASDFLEFPLGLKL